MKCLQRPCSASTSPIRLSYMAAADNTQSVVIQLFCVSILEYLHSKIKYSAPSTTILTYRRVYSQCYSNKSNFHFTYRVRTCCKNLTYNPDSKNEGIFSVYPQGTTRLNIEYVIFGSANRLIDFYLCFTQLLWNQDCIRVSREPFKMKLRRNAYICAAKQ